MRESLLSLVFALPVLGLLLACAGAVWRSVPALAAALPWVTAAAPALVLAPFGLVELDSVLLGSRLLLDWPARATALGCGAALVLLWFSNRARFAASPGPAACWLLVWIGVLTQSLAGDLLLYLAGASLAGYAMLAATAVVWLEIGPWRVAALALVLLAGDLALLELATLLAEDGGGSAYDVAAETLAGTRGKLLVELCIALGFASRPALLAAIAAWAGTRQRRGVRLLPGWLALGLCSALGSWRIAPAWPAGAGAPAPWIVALAWALPLLLVVLALPWSLRVGRAALLRVGSRSASLRDAARGAARRVFRGGIRTLLVEAEARVVLWPVAMSLLVLLATALLFLLLS